MNKIIYINIITILSILLIFSIALIFIYRKKLRDISLLISSYKDKMGKDYEKDISFLNNIIANRIIYVKNSIIPNMYTNKKIINDDMYTELLKNMVEEITNITSDNYKDLIEFYVGDFEKFIVLKIDSILKPYLLTKNIKTFKGDGLSNKVDLDKYLNESTKDVIKDLKEKI